jgi:hypothetical protein
MKFEKKKPPAKKLMLPGKPEDSIDKKLTPELAKKIRKKASVILGTGTEY